jgi:sugar lactone lactonase YvrE
MVRFEAGHFTAIGKGLTRPECVAATRSGAVYCSHFGGGVTRIDPDGSQRDILGPGDPVVATNGFSLMPDGSALCASLLPPGGVWRVTPDGRQEPFLTELDGTTLPPCNFVNLDYRGRVWATVSTKRVPRALGYRKDVADGYIIVKDEKGVRIAAEGFGYTNEALVHPDGEHLYVNETFARRLTRMRITDDNRLIERETVAEFGPGIFPDGLGFDAEGGVWIVSIISNTVIRVTPDGGQQIVLHDADADHIDFVEADYHAGRMDRPHLDEVKSSYLRNVSSVAFGGPDLKTVYFGNLLDDRIYSWQSPVAGAEPPHWSYDL